MGSFPASAALRLPVRFRGILIGRPVDVLLETSAWRAVGLVVLCGDGVERFLPSAAAEPRETEIVVGSALILLDDVAFYRARSTSLRSLLGRPFERDGKPLGTLRDVLIDPRGAVLELELELGDERVRVEPRGVAPSAARASAA